MIIWLLVMFTPNHTLTARAYETEQQCLYQMAQPRRDHNVWDCLPVLLEKVNEAKK